MSPGCRCRRQRAGTIGLAAEATARSAIREGAIDSIGRSAHPGQQRTDLPPCDPHSKLFRQTSSQFVIRQILAEEPNKIICVMIVENHVVPSMELRLDSFLENPLVRCEIEAICWRSPEDGQWVKAIHRPPGMRHQAPTLRAQSCHASRCGLRARIKLLGDGDIHLHIQRRSGDTGECTHNGSTLAGCHATATRIRLRLPMMLLVGSKSTQPAPGR